MSLAEVRSLINAIVCHCQLKLSMDEKGNSFHLFCSQYGLNRYNIGLFHYTGSVLFLYITIP